MMLCTVTDFPQPGLADDRESLTFIHAEVDPSYGVNNAAVRREFPRAGS